MNDCHVYNSKRRLKCPRNFWRPPWVLPQYSKLTSYLFSNPLTPFFTPRNAWHNLLPCRLSAKLEWEVKCHYTKLLKFNLVSISRPQIVVTKQQQSTYIANHKIRHRKGGGKKEKKVTLPVDSFNVLARQNVIWNSKLQLESWIPSQKFVLSFYHFPAKL